MGGGGGAQQEWQVPDYSTVVGLNHPALCSHTGIFFELVIVSRLYSNSLNFLWANRSNSARDLTDNDLSASLIILNTWVIIKLIDFSKKRFSTVKHFNS